MHCRVLFVELRIRGLTHVFMCRNAVMAGHTRLFHAFVAEIAEADYQHNLAIYAFNPSIQTNPYSFKHLIKNGGPNKTFLEIF